ncbi:MAG TPA: hypothetical protein VIA29_08175 [Thermoanaerobaculia bacterium]|jgi:hypothetical protein
MTRARLVLLLLAAVLAAVPTPARSAPLEDLQDDPGAVAVFIAVEPEKPVAGEPVIFYAVFKGTPLPGTTVAWNFSEEKAVGNPVRIVFERAGQKAVEVEVWQPGIKPLADSMVLDVEDSKPVPGPEGGAVEVFFEVDSKIQAKVPVSFIAVFKGTPLEGSVVAWDFGGREPVFGNPVRTVFPDAGKRLVTVTLEQPGRKAISYGAWILVYPQRLERKWR